MLTGNPTTMASTSLPQVAPTTAITTTADVPRTGTIRLAKEDIEVALKSIQSTFQPEADRDGDASADTTTGDCTQRQLLTDCVTLHCTKIDSFVRPVPESELLENLEKADKGTTTATPDAATLLDSAAHQRLKGLRQQVRDQAASFAALRSTTMRRPYALSKQLFSELAQTTNETVDEESSSSDDRSSSNLLLPAQRQKIDKVKQNLRQLAVRLEKANAEIPAQLQKTNESLQEVEKGLSSSTTSRVDRALQERYTDDSNVRGLPEALLATSSTSNIGALLSAWKVGS